MRKTLSRLTTIKFNNWGEFFSSPLVAGISQATSITAGISSFIQAEYQQQTYETMLNYLSLVHSKVSTIEQVKIDEDFLSSQDGKRIIAKVLKSVIRDNRKEKINASANLTVNLYTDMKITIEEKELYVDILDVRYTSVVYTF